MHRRSVSARLARQVINRHTGSSFSFKHKQPPNLCSTYYAHHHEANVITQLRYHGDSDTVYDVVNVADALSINSQN